MLDPTGHQPGAVPSRVLTALRGETQRLDAPGDVPVSFASLSPAERAQDRAETCLSDLTLALLSRGSDPAAHAQRMAVATHAAAQALLSAYVLWLAQAEAGGLNVPLPPLAAEPAPNSVIVPEACTVEAFARVGLINDPAGAVPVPEAYDTYVAWCMGRSFAVRTRSGFAVALQRLGYGRELRPVDGVRVWHVSGARLLSDTAERGA